MPRVQEPDHTHRVRSGYIRSAISVYIEHNPGTHVGVIELRRIGQCSLAGARQQRDVASVVAFPEHDYVDIAILIEIAGQYAEGKQHRGKVVGCSGERCSTSVQVHVQSREIGISLKCCVQKIRECSTLFAKKLLALSTVVPKKTEDPWNF